MQAITIGYGLCGGPLKCWPVRPDRRRGPVSREGERVRALTHGPRRVSSKSSPSSTKKPRFLRIVTAPSSPTPPKALADVPIVACCNVMRDAGNRFRVIEPAIEREPIFDRGTEAEGMHKRRLIWVIVQLYRPKYVAMRDVTDSHDPIVRRPSDSERRNCALTGRSRVQTQRYRGRRPACRCGRRRRGRVCS